MSDIAIKVENLSKKYLLGTAASGNLRDTLSNGWGQLIGKEKKAEKKEFWALKDVSFEVKKGEVIGVIGRNGAGKSTLLKILSRITEPTSGRVELNGRVASLLEVGTGFHPELSGRENIFLNGALLGMTRAEIKRKFDEIIDFSGVEVFIDTPVKKYSSGMYVRLAFAVAAHLEPEILLVDEVLAVGDAEFQKKCLGKMDEVAKEGRTVVFVSHNMGTLVNLCTNGVVLTNGMISNKLDIIDAITLYHNHNSIPSSKFLENRKDRNGNGNLRFCNVRIYNSDNNESIEVIESGMDVEFRIKTKKKIDKIINLRIDIRINNDVEQRLSWLSSSLTQEKGLILTNDTIVVKVKKFPFVQGKYSLTLCATSDEILLDWVQNAFYFQVENGFYYLSGKIPPKNQGPFLLTHSIEVL